MKNRTNIIFIIIVVLILGGLITMAVLSSISQPVPDGTVGNTAGNLNNGGLFAETSGGRVYFSNAYDGGRLYSMNADQTDIKKIYDLSAQFINVGGDYVFFYGKAREGGTGLGSFVAKPALMMVKKNGKKASMITREITQKMVLVGSTIFCEHYTDKPSIELGKIPLKAKKVEDVLDYTVNPACYYNGKLYYNGMVEDHHLYSYDVTSGVTETVWEGEVWFPYYDGAYLYYLDIKNGYRLCRYSFSENTIEVLESERVDCFNVYGNIIYYQTNSDTPMLMRMRTDGSAKEIVAEGIFTHINITSSYVYFNEFASEIPIYCTPTYGNVNVQAFTKARDAIKIQ